MKAAKKTKIEAGRVAIINGKRYEALKVRGNSVHLKADGNPYPVFCCAELVRKCLVAG